MSCVKCGSDNRYKFGFYNGLQKWKCKDCGHASCRTAPRGKDPEWKRLALVMICEGVPIRAIARIFGEMGRRISDVAIGKWLRQAGAGAPKAPDHVIRDAQIIELDEMYLFCQKNSRNTGCGWLLIPLPENLSLGESVIVLAPR